MRGYRAGDSLDFEARQDDGFHPGDSTQLPDKLLDKASVSSSTGQG